MNGLYSPIETLPGIGEKRAQKYRKLGIETPYDLLCHFPRTYVDFTEPLAIDETEPDTACAVRARVVQKYPPKFVRNGITIYRVLVNDGTEDLTLVFFNTPYTYEAMRPSAEYFLYGKVSAGFTGREMNSPQVQLCEGAMLLLPVYPQTTGLTSAMIRTNVKTALTLLDAAGVETLPEDFRAAHALIPLVDALNGIHRPPDKETLETARRRLAFEELLQFQLGTLMLRHRAESLSSAAMSENTDLSAFYSALPFTLTNAQRRAIDAICKDLCREKPMNRLLQGDVGSGKTVVAAAAAAFTAQNGYQTCLMTPTEILARQHLDTLRSFLEPVGVRTALLTGAAKAKERAEIRAKLQSGEIDMLVGTHAVIQKGVEFSNLGLVITDEQHRFGVRQRAALAQKGGTPHKLVMSATPIPRTLALIIYGDLDVTPLDEMPRGRLPVKTYAVTGAYRERAYAFIAKQLDAGQQAFLVCAMVEDSDQLENVQAAQSYAEKLRQGAFSRYRVGLLHGRMKSKEKEAVMAAMQAREIDLLVCTTVVEVGVDIPNATVILIENADRFGMAQLHQLRGRVGRGALQSHCILITDSHSEEARERLRVLARTTDGFEIAEEDLRLRGPGDFFGHAQHGMPPLVQTAFSGDMALVRETQQAAQEILREDPQLSLPRYHKLRAAVMQMFSKSGDNTFN